MKFLLASTLVLTALTTPAIAAAASLSPKSHPKTFCDLAKDLGYPSRGYKESTGGCASNMIEVTSTPGKGGLRNNLAFYSMGEYDSPSKLQRVSLILNVNNPAEKAPAQAELARVAVALAKKIAGQAPADLNDIILKAKSKTWPTGEWAIDVKTTVWPTGLGQDTTIYFRPAAN